MDRKIAFSVKKARAVQSIIARKVVEEDRINYPISKVAGIDVTYREGKAIAVAVVLDSQTFRPLDVGVSVMKPIIPYIPTLLAFREVGPVAAAIKKLSVSFDLLFVDGNGRLHPYRAGFACHIGVALDVPTIGVAKKLLCGRIGEWKGDRAPVYLDDEVVGMALKTTKRAKPIYVSVGHKVSLETAVKLTLWYARGRKLPIPLVLAHQLTQQEAKKILTG